MGDHVMFVIKIELSKVTSDKAPVNSAGHTYPTFSQKLPMCLLTLQLLR